MKDVYNPSKLYTPKDPELNMLFGDSDKLAQWRHRGIGPAYIKVGRSVRYLGSDLNEYLHRNRISTKDSPQ